MYHSNTKGKPDYPCTPMKHDGSGFALCHRYPSSNTQKYAYKKKKIGQNTADSNDIPRRQVIYDPLCHNRMPPMC